MPEASSTSMEDAEAADFGAQAGEATVVAGLSATVRRQRVFLAMAVIAALGSAGGLVASTLVKSPAQQAAETKPPAANVLTSPVVSRVLANTLITRGAVRAQSTITVTPTSAAAGSQLLVTALRKQAGSSVKAGDVLVEVSGRPVIALHGAVPSYRDLKPGDDGADVTELQTALAELGYPAKSDKKGYFGINTKAAVTHLYQHLGYDVPTTGGPSDKADATALRSAAQAVTAASRAVTMDQVAASQAQHAYTAAVAAAKSPTVEAPAVQQAKDALDAANTTLANAQSDLSQAQQAQAALVASTGPMLPVAESVFVPSFPVQLTKINGGVGSTVTAPLLTLNGGALGAYATLSSGQNELVHPGTKVQLLSESLGGDPVTATVASIGAYNIGGQAAASGAGSGGGQSAASGAGTVGGSADSSRDANATPGYPLTVVPDSPLPADWNGLDVRVTIIAASTPGPVLVVPLSAVAAAADGQTFVTVSAADGSGQHRVQVTAGVSGDGFVEVTPKPDGSLKAGDLVVVGQGDSGGSSNSGAVGGGQ
jgi:multidrug efflux pump subunit AcrA (membrane-fusion protein)